MAEVVGLDRFCVAFGTCPEVAVCWCETRKDLKAESDFEMRYVLGTAVLEGETCRCQK